MTTTNGNATQSELEGYLEEHPELVDALFPHWNPLIAQKPLPKQTAFLMLPHLEAFFGGAAGGGKTSVLCMAALQYVDVPRYNAIIFRKTYTDHHKPSSPGHRISEWLAQQFDTGAVSTREWGFKFNGELMQYTFQPSGATLTLGNMGTQNSRYRYQGTEFQFIGWDELGQHEEEDYTYMFSRLRKVACPIHQTYDHCQATGDSITQFELLGTPGICSCCGEEWFPDGSHHNGYHKGDPIYAEGCVTCSNARCVPLRVRATGNPPSLSEPGASKGWIKNRFKITKQPNGQFRGTHPTRFHMPSYASDNTHLNANEYAASLSEMNPVMREQMLRGDWDVMADGLFRWDWQRKYTYRSNPTVGVPQDWNVEGRTEYNPSDFFILGEPVDGHNPFTTFLARQCICFSVVDAAGSFREGLMRDQIYVRGVASHTVISTFLLTPNWHLIWLDMVRFQREIPAINPALLDVWKRLRPSYFVIEANGFNVGVEQYARAEGFLVVPYYPPAHDLAVRATDAMIRMERGQIWFPAADLPWVRTATSEIFTWVGRKDQTDDIVSTLSMAANEATRRAMSREKKDPKQGNRSIPMASGGLRF